MKDVFDFRLVYSSAVRTVCTHPSMEGITLLTQTYVDYIDAMDLQPIDCALRDFYEWLYPEESRFIPLYSDGTDSYKAYREQLRPLIESMIRFHLESPDPYKYNSAEFEGIADIYRIVDAAHDTAYPHPFTYKETEKDVPTADNKRLSELIVLSTKYACGRHTYMPGAVSTFIIRNLPDITDEGLEDIADAIQSVPEDHSFMADACDDYMRKCLAEVKAEIRQRKSGNDCNERC